MDTQSYLRSLPPNALIWHKNPGVSDTPPVPRGDWRGNVRYRGGPGFDPFNYKPSGLDANVYTWRHSDPPHEGDIIEYALLG